MTPVDAFLDSPTRQVSATVVPETTREVHQGFVLEHVNPETLIYTDDSVVYRNLENHESVRHSAQEYVRGDVHTNSVESFWSMLKPAHAGTFHKLSLKHLKRYVGEFVGRHNMRELDTIDQMKSIVRGMEGSRLRYKDLIR